MDPSNKARAFSLMRELSIEKAVVRFSGGNDEGGTDAIKITRAGGEDDLDVVYPDYEVVGGRYEARREAPSKTDELSLLLQEPVDEKWGSWDGAFTAYGTLTWTLADETAVMDYEESAFDSHSEEW